MTTTPQKPTLPGRRGPQVVLLLLALLVVAVVWLQGVMGRSDLLNQMARRSLPLPEALANGQPSVVEFYADWCESCRRMAPAMAELEKQHPNLNVVLLNVDNPAWQGQLQRWGVNGIPHLQLFDAKGEAVGKAIGLRQSGELQAIATALQTEAPLPALAGVGEVSELPLEPSSKEVSSSAGPRSHG